jgi:hypothetical protein
MLGHTASLLDHGQVLFGVIRAAGLARAGQGRDRRSGATRRRRFACRLAPGSWSHFWSHPPVFGRVQHAPAVTHRHWSGRWRIIVNSSKQNWKACWVQALASSNLASSATVTSVNSKASPSVQAGSHVSWLQFWFRASADLTANNSLTWVFAADTLDLRSPPCGLTLGKLGRTTKSGLRTRRPAASSPVINVGRARRPITA